MEKDIQEMIEKMVTMSEDISDEASRYFKLYMYACALLDDFKPLPNGKWHDFIIETLKDNYS